MSGGSGAASTTSALMITPHSASRIPSQFCIMNGAVRSLGLAARFMPMPGLSPWSRLDRARSDEPLVGNRDLIRVAVARSPSQACPLSGIYDGSPSDCDGM